MNRPIATLLLVLLGLVLVDNAALAQRRGGGVQSRGSARTSVNQNVNRNQNVNVNRNRNVNVNQNRNVNVNVNRNVDVNVHGGYGYHGCCYNSGPSVAGAVVATVATALVIGSIVNSIPPSCTTVIVRGLTYQQCGSTWYQPQFVGTSTTYVVVAAPG